MNTFVRTAAAAALVAAATLAWPAARVTARQALNRPATQQPQDLGPTNPSQTLSASVVLKVRNPQQLEAFVAGTQDPGSPVYHRFLGLNEFVANFSPSAQDVAVITNYLSGFGITVNEVYPNRLLLRITGATDAFNRAFALNVHDFVRGNSRFHKPTSAPAIPVLLQDLLVTIVGPSDAPNFRPMHRRASASARAARLTAHALPTANVLATGAPGDYTVGDVANMYDVNPLYAAHLDGHGRTLGIVTLADFLPSDAFAYWSLVGLTVDPNRITQIHVDGGGAFGSDAGSGETSLDVEQSGGLAPGAAIRVFDAPNSNVGFIDAFYRAISENAVDSLSTSWGEAEEFYSEAVVGQDLTPELTAFHQVFLEAASQGISMFAAAGDNGAYDINTAFNDPVNNVLSVDVPGSDPAITSSGGTTTPVEFIPSDPTQPTLTIAHEQAWGWDYLENYLIVLGVFPPGDTTLFPTGTGGGVSVMWGVPAYQSQTAGLRKTEPHQSVVFQGQTLLKLPPSFKGRNVPDISLNADPETGYIIISTADGGFVDGFGGTSFVAPQLNGITALISQGVHGRVGFMNPMLYRFQNVYAHGPSPIVDITGGDNWFYTGVPGYEPATGLGVIDAARLFGAVRFDRFFN